MNTYRHVATLAILAFALIVPAFGDEPAAAPETGPAAAVTVKDVALEKVGEELFFRVKLEWPNQGVPAVRPSTQTGTLFDRFTSYTWPSEALALIPQSPEAFNVFRDTTAEERPFTDALPRTPTFVGKLRTAAKVDFLLRCPAPDNKWQYLPLAVDFSSPPHIEGLAAQWAGAELDFISRYPAAEDQSFFAYAQARLETRLGKSARPDGRRFGWRGTPDGAERYYEITTGALALQESLQLDRMRNANADVGERSIPIDSISGVTVQAHPWAEMIGQQKPEIEPLAALVPADQYYVRFKTTKAMHEILEFTEQWGGSVLSKMEVAGRDYGVREKIETQICLRSTWLSELLGPAVIDSFAITGCDPYLREGSDFSIIFRLKAAPVFETATGRFLSAARKAHADLQEGTEEYQGVSIQWLRTPDLTVRCYRARFDEYCVYSNSPAAIRRIIDARADRVLSLAKSLDFVYMRTIYPLNAAEEDGFVFLSDPFIRTTVGPRLRIGEKRRIEAVTSLEMVKNAALLYLWEHPGAATPDMKTLTDGGYLDPKQVAAEPGDQINWDPAAFTASSTRYGRLGFLTPLIELPIDKATEREKADYEQFRTRYQDYWRRYFDPVGIRMSAGDTIAFSVTILPLIDNSTYAEMVDNFGGNPTRLEPEHDVGARIVHFAAHLNPASRTLREIQNFMISMLPDNPGFNLGWIGQRMEYWVEDSDALAALMRDGKFGHIFKVPITFGVQVKNPLTLAGFLVAAQALIRASAPNLVAFEPLEPYRDAAFTAIRTAKDFPDREDEQLKDAAIYYGVVGGYLYLSTSLDTLHRIVDIARDGPATRPAGEKAPPPTKGHMALTLSPANAKKSLPALESFLAGDAWNAEQEHLHSLWLVAHTVGLGPRGAPPPKRVLGFRVESALGNTYRYDPSRDEVVGSVTGSLWSGERPSTLPDGSPLKKLLGSLIDVRATLAFTKEGLRTELTIRRTPQQEAGPMTRPSP